MFSSHGFDVLGIVFLFPRIDTPLFLVGNKFLYF